MNIAKDHPRINSKRTSQSDNPLLEYQDGHLVGKNPLTADVFLMQEAGHREMSPYKIMRQKCLDCVGFQASEVRKCVCTDCPLFPYRMGKDPFKSAKCKAKKMHGNLAKAEG